jgi:hypothetical protein
MVLVILLAPAGLVGTLRDVVRRIRHRRPPEAAPPSNAATPRAVVVTTSKGEPR